MKLSHVLGTFVLAGGVAALISFYLDPKFSEPVSAPEQGQMSAPNVSSLAIEPPVQQSSARRTATISARPDGHYWTRALVNRKTSVEFMVDTGASVVALTYKDAQKMGLRPETLDYKWEIRTAGGITKGASVKIDSIQINQVHVRNVDAMVLRTDLSQSLLGMSFLRELYSYEFRGNRMIIQQ
ncbi:MAG: TIGR02281 family clan AA aspartic protease [Pseudomonadota bacterium]